VVLELAVAQVVTKRREAPLRAFADQEPPDRLTLRFEGTRRLRKRPTTPDDRQMRPLPEGFGDELAIAHLGGSGLNRRVHCGLGRRCASVGKDKPEHAATHLCRGVEGMLARELAPALGSVRALRFRQDPARERLVVDEDARDPDALRLLVFVTVRVIEAA